MGRPMKTTASNQKQPLGLIAYEQICRKIITLDYEPGQILEEKQLMEDLGLGRTPIREALLRLAGERMVESQPGRGIIVPPITLQGTKAVFEAMKILELGIVSLAVCQNTNPLLPQMATASDAVTAAIEARDMLGLVEANHTFHMYFARCSHNEYLVRAVSEVRNEAKRLSYLSYANEIESANSLQTHYESVIREHEEIITHLRERNETELNETLLKHINTFQQRIIHYMTS